MNPSPPGWLRGLAAALMAAVLILTAWGVGLAVQGGLARLLPSPQPRLPWHAYVVRELGSGRYLFYTEVQLRPGDLFISPADEVYRIERVGFDTAWARLLGPRARVLGPGGQLKEPAPQGSQGGQAGSP